MKNKIFLVLDMLLDITFFILIVSAWIGEYIVSKNPINFFITFSGLYLIIWDVIDLLRDIKEICKLKEEK